MKVLVSLIVMFSFLLLPGFRMEASSKNEVYILTRDITLPVLDKVKSKIKKMDNGVTIEFKSKKEDKLAALKGIMDKAMQQCAALQGNPRPYELLYVKAVKATLTEIPQGLKLELTSDEKEMVDIIKKVQLPKKPRRHGDMLDSTDEIVGSDSIE